MDRDFDANPYDEHERRVCDYLRSITGDMVGCGDDPVGFLIASHAALAAELRGRRGSRAPAVVSATLEDESGKRELIPAQSPSYGAPPENPGGGRTCQVCGRSEKEHAPLGASSTSRRASPSCSASRLPAGCRTRSSPACVSGGCAGAAC